jgi:hypothetical protein
LKPQYQVFFRAFIYKLLTNKAVFDYITQGNRFLLWYFLRFFVVKTSSERIKSMPRVDESGEPKKKAPRKPRKKPGETAALTPGDLKEFEQVPGLRAEPSPNDAKVIETQTKTTKTLYSTPRPTDDLQELGELVEIEDEPLDLFSQMLLTMNEDGELTCRVRRLPDPPTMRGRFREPCLAEISYGQMTIQNPLDYEVEVRDFCGSGGKYRIQLIDRGIIRKTVDKIIGDPPRQPLAVQPNGQPYPPQYQPVYQQPPDPMQQMIAQAKNLADLKNVFAILSPPPAPPVTVTPEKDTKTVIAELVLQNPEARKQVVEKIFGFAITEGSPKEEKIPWYGRALLAAAENPELMKVAAPLAMGLFSMVINKFGFTRPAQANGQPAPPDGSTMTVPQTGLQPPPFADPNATGGYPNYPAGQAQAPENDDGEGEDQLTVFELVLQGVMDELAQNRPITDFQWLVTLEKSFPAEVSQMKQLLFTLPVASLMPIIATYGPDYAAAMRLPHAAGYLEVLVNQIKERENKANEHSTSDSVNKPSVGGSDT